MKKTSITVILILFGNFLFAQVSGCHNILQSKINLEFIENASECQVSYTKNGVSEFNGKTEIWSVCELEKGNRILRIESYKNETFFQEIYFELNGKLRYAKETENYNPKNGFTQMSWNCEFFFDDDGKDLITIVSLGHGKTEIDSWEPESIIEMYKERIFELKKMERITKGK